MRICVIFHGMIFENSTFLSVRLPILRCIFKQDTNKWVILYHLIFFVFAERYKKIDFKEIISNSEREKSNLPKPQQCHTV